MMFFKNDITHIVGALHLSTGQDAGVEAVVHAMHEIFPEENIEAILLVGAENAFNSINQKVLTHDIKFLYPLPITSKISDKNLSQEDAKASFLSLLLNSVKFLMRSWGNLVGLLPRNYF